MTRPTPLAMNQRLTHPSTLNVQPSTFDVRRSTFDVPPSLPALILLSLLFLHAPNTHAADPATNNPPPPTPAAPTPDTNTPLARATPITTTTPRASTNTLTLESFRIIGDRNIFNPNRSSRTARGTNEIRRTPKIDSIAFVGTMAFTKGTFAFFNSSSSDYRKRLTRGELIAGFEIKEIHPSLIKLEHDGQIMQLKLGQQLRREDDGPWQVSDRSDSTSTPNSSASTSDSPSEAPPPGASDLLRRLMEKRQQETKQ